MNIPKYIVIIYVMLPFASFGVMNECSMHMQQSVPEGVVNVSVLGLCVSKD